MANTYRQVKLINHIAHFGKTWSTGREEPACVGKSVHVLGTLKEAVCVVTIDQFTMETNPGPNCFHNFPLCALLLLFVLCLDSRLNYFQAF